MRNSDKEKSIRNVISLMKLSHLKELAKSFEINVREKKKENFIENIELYIKNNISIILKKKYMLY